MAGPGSPTQSQMSQTGVILSATQAGPPRGLPTFLMRPCLGGEQGMVLTRAADANVRMTAGFYCTQLEVYGWTSVQSVLGPMTGSSEDSSGFGGVQAATPGSALTATPAGSLSEAWYCGPRAVPRSRSNPRSVNRAAQRYSSSSANNDLVDVLPLPLHEETSGRTGWIDPG